MIVEPTIRTIVLALGWFFAIEAGFSLASAPLARYLLRRDAAGSRWLLVLRLGPSLASVLFVTAMFLPSHWALEPREANETLGYVWYTFAAAGAWLCARGAGRAMRLTAMNARIRRGARRIRVGNVEVDEVPAIDGVSLAGIFRPRILVGRGVLDRLSPAELSVAITHEIAHSQAFDNVLRWCFACAPDVLSGTSHARRLEQSWHARAEALADARAVDGDRIRACHLASALLKVARHAAGLPPSQLPAWSTLHDGELLEWRIQRLTARIPPAAEPLPAFLRTAAAVVAVLFVAVPLVAASVHAVTEALVRLLP